MAFMLALFLKCSTEVKEPVFNPDSLKGTSWSVHVTDVAQINTKGFVNDQIYFLLFLDNDKCRFVFYSSTGHSKNLPYKKINDLILNYQRINQPWENGWGNPCTAIIRLSNGFLISAKFKKDRPEELMGYFLSNGKDRIELDYLYYTDLVGSDEFKDSYDR